jgi:hypothetical protein
MGRGRQELWARSITKGPVSQTSVCVQADLSGRLSVQVLRVVEGLLLAYKVLLNSFKAHWSIVARDRERNRNL